MRSSLIFAAMAAFAATPAAAKPLGLMVLVGTVASCYDGDTCTVVPDGWAEDDTVKIRLWAFDTEEIRGGTPEQRQRARAARDYLRNIAVGKKVACNVFDADRYGRLVSQCYLPGGEDIGVLMINAGHALECVNFSGGEYAGLQENDDLHRKDWCER